MERYFFFDVSVLVRSRGPKTEPWNEAKCQVSLGGCHFVEDGGHKRGPHPACGPKPEKSHLTESIFAFAKMHMSDLFSD